MEFGVKIEITEINFTTCMVSYNKLENDEDISNMK